MNFQLKPLSLAQATTLLTDALVVLVPATLPRDSSPLGTLVTQAVRAGDLDLAKPGKLLPMWRVPGIQAPRLVLKDLVAKAAKRNLKLKTNGSLYLMVKLPTVGIPMAKPLLVKHGKLWMAL